MRAFLGISMLAGALAIIAYVVTQFSSDAAAMFLGMVLAILASVPFAVAMAAPAPHSRTVRRELEPPRVVEHHLYLHGDAAQVEVPRVIVVDREQVRIEAARHGWQVREYEV